MTIKYRLFEEGLSVFEMNVNEFIKQNIGLILTIYSIIYYTT